MNELPKITETIKPITQKFEFIVEYNHIAYGISLDRLIELFADGKWSNEHVYYYKITDFPLLLCYKSSNYQGISSYAYLITKEKFEERMKRYLGGDHNHSLRAKEALNKIGIKIPEI